MKIMVSGLVNVETTVAVRGFPIWYYPIDYPFFGVNSGVSGVGYNVAKALTSLGDEVKLFSFVGKDDEGKRVFDRMRSDIIGTDGVFDSLSATPSSAVLFDPDGRRQIYCDLKDIQEQNISPRVSDEELKSFDAASLCNINFNRELIKRARALGVTTATDVHVLGNIDDEYNRDFMENADILFLSDEALPCSADEFIRRLEDRYHNKVIVIGMGAKGAMLFDKMSGEISFVDAYRREDIVNTVGAGDALFSSFLHFYLKSGDAKGSLGRAVVFAGVKICYNGASAGFSSEEETERIFGNR